MNGLTSALTLTLSPRRGNSSRAQLGCSDVFMPVAALLQFAPDANGTNNAARQALTPRAFPPLPGGEGRGEGGSSHKSFLPFFIQPSSFCNFV